MNLPWAQVTTEEVPPIDIDAVKQEDEVRESQGLPPRFAIPNPVNIQPLVDGTCETPGESPMVVCRLVVKADGAKSLNFGFTEYLMSEGSSLLIYDPEDPDKSIRPFTDQDNAPHGELWTPIVESSQVIIEVSYQVQGDMPQLTLGSINYGYRGLGTGSYGDSAHHGRDLAQWCNVDVVCPEADDWREEIPSVALFALNGFLTCTGFMVNNVEENQHPYFMTAEVRLCLQERQLC